MQQYKSCYNMFDIKLCLETPHAEINDFCDYMWQEFVCSIPPNVATTIQVLPYVDKKKCYTIFRQGKIATDQGGELRELPYAILTKALENIVSGHAINQIDKREIITLHSGVVSKNNKGILILGESGDGKSTFTLEMVAHHDWLYLTDEVGLLDNNFNLLPFLKTISYQPGIVQLDDKWMSKQLGMDHQLAVPKKKYGEPVPLKGIFFIKYAPESPPAIAPIKRSESLARLLNAQIGRAKYVATVEHMAEIVRRVNSYQIMHNDATEAACLVTELMETE